MNGVKNDDGKPQLDLLPYDSLVDITRVLEYGLQKYARDNWKKGIAIRRLLSATLRHLHTFNEGIDLDAESGLSHLAHAGSNVLFMLWLMHHKPECDDRKLF